MVAERERRTAHARFLSAPPLNQSHVLQRKRGHVAITDESSHHISAQITQLLSNLAAVVIQPIRFRSPYAARPEVCSTRAAGLSNNKGEVVCVDNLPCVNNIGLDSQNKKQKMVS